KQTVPFDKLTSWIEATLIEYDETLFSQATEFQQENIYRPSTYEEMKDYLSSTSGFAIAPWDGKKESEAQVKKDTKATIRCLPVSDSDLDSAIETGAFPESETTSDKCIITGEAATEMAVFAQAY
nr:hypothetical protein [Acidimicrobiia bacterium]